MKGTTFYSPRANRGVFGGLEKGNKKNVSFCMSGTPWESLNPESKNPESKKCEKNTRKKQIPRKCCVNPYKRG